MFYTVFRLVCPAMVWVVQTIVFSKQMMDPTSTG
jgi:hypothetical protein